MVREKNLNSINCGNVKTRYDCSKLGSTGKGEGINVLIWGVKGHSLKMLELKLDFYRCYLKLQR